MKTITQAELVCRAQEAAEEVATGLDRLNATVECEPLMSREEFVRMLTSEFASVLMRRVYVR